MKIQLAIVILGLIELSSTASSSSLECGACMMIVNEVESGIRAVDPKKVVDAGSFRVNPKGEQIGLQKVPYARSNGHIVELLEGACGKSSEYRHVVNRLTGKKVYVNKKSTYLEGDESKGMQSKLHGACNDLIDDREEELEKFFQKEHEDPVRELCMKQLTVCTSVDVSPLPPMEPVEDKKEDNDDNDEL